MYGGGLKRGGWSSFFGVDFQNPESAERPYRSNRAEASRINPGLFVQIVQESFAKPRRSLRRIATKPSVEKCAKT